MTCENLRLIKLIFNSALIAVYVTLMCHSIDFFSLGYQIISSHELQALCVGWYNQKVSGENCEASSFVVLTTRGCADKSLARTGRKQATATKLGIYSIHSPRSSIHFLARCFKFCKSLKKNSECCPFNQVSASAMT